MNNKLVYFIFLEQQKEDLEKEYTEKSSKLTSEKENHIQKHD